MIQILNRAQWSALLISLLGLSVLFLSPIPELLDRNQLIALCVIAIALIMFATSALPEHLTALLFMLSAMLTSIAPADVVFSGFSSTACWLIFAGLILGIAINETGLARRLAAGMSRHFDSSYLRLIAGIVIIATLLGFLMPSSMGRAVLFLPIAMAMAERCGFKPGSNGQIGVALAAAFGCHVPTFAVLPANVPNMVMVGAAETIHQWSPAYAEYLFLHFPVLGLLKGLLIIAAIIWLYPDSPSRSAAPVDQQAISADEKKLIAIMALTLGFWLTDSLHNISPAWIGLSAACVLLLPGIGLVSQQSFNSKMNIGSIIFVVGILGLGTLTNYSGLGAMLGEKMNQWLPLSEAESFISFITLSVTSFVVAMLTTLPGVPAVMTPFAELFSAKSGMSLEAVIMTQVLGFSTIMFPYQSAPLVVAMQIAGVPLKHAAKLCFVIAPLTLLALFPLDYLWWRLLGWI